MSIGRPKRLEDAVTEAARDWKAIRARTSNLAGPTAPGDLFVFDTGEEAAIEWLVVREHPDDPEPVLLAAADDFPLAGTPDVALPHDLVRRLLTVRTGEAFWAPVQFCQERLRSDRLPIEAVQLVRRKLADLARGRGEATEAEREADADPEYEEWIEVVARARVRLQQRADRLPLEQGVVIPLQSMQDRVPMELAAEPEFALAAEPGNSLFPGLSQAIGEPDTRYYAVEVRAGGKFILKTTEGGVRAVWLALDGAAPPQIIGRNLNGEPFRATWEAGPENRLHKTGVFPWIDRQVALTIAIDPPKTYTIER